MRGGFEPRPSFSRYAARTHVPTCVCMQEAKRCRLMKPHSAAHACARVRVLGVASPVLDVLPAPVRVITNITSSGCFARRVRGALPAPVRGSSPAPVRDVLPAPVRDVLHAPVRGASPAESRCFARRVRGVLPTEFPVFCPQSSRCVAHRAC